MNQLIVFRVYLVWTAIAVRTVEGFRFLLLRRICGILPFWPIRVHFDGTHVSICCIHQIAFAVCAEFMSFPAVLQCGFLECEFPSTDNLPSQFGFVRAILRENADAESTHSED